MIVERCPVSPLLVQHKLPVSFLPPMMNVVQQAVILSARRLGQSNGEIEKLFLHSCFRRHTKRNSNRLPPSFIRFARRSCRSARPLPCV